MTRLEIINAVLTRCGAATVAAETDTNDSRAVVANYQSCVDFVTEDREWTFASDLVVLNLDPNPPAFMFTYQYIIPAGVLRVVRAYRDPSATVPIEADDWVRKRQHVLTNWAGTVVNQPGVVGPLYAEALVRVDVSEFSPGACQALIEYLISVCAMPITENKDVAKEAAAAYLGKVSDAAAMDGSQGRTKQLTPPALPGRRAHVIR